MNKNLLRLLASDLLSSDGRTVLVAIYDRPQSVGQLADRFDWPKERVRAGLRELVALGVLKTPSIRPTKPNRSSSASYGDEAG